MIVKNDNKIYSDCGLLVRVKGTLEAYSSLSGYLRDLADYEEVTAETVAAEKAAADTRAAYERRVNDLIRERYSESAEFALLRQQTAKADEFAAYTAYAEECKARAKAELTAAQEGGEL